MCTYMLRDNFWKAIQETARVVTSGGGELES